MSPKDVLSPDEHLLLDEIRWLSRFRACTATSQTLARKLHWSESKVKRLLASLEERGFIYREVEWLTKPGDKEYRKKRTIYLKSSASDEEGALLLANLVRDTGKTTTMSDDEFCGKLQCTHDELARWLSVAQERDYIAVTSTPATGVHPHVGGLFGIAKDTPESESPQRIIRRIGIFDRVPLPTPTEPRCVAVPRQSAIDRLVELVAEKDFEGTDQQLGSFLGVRQSTARQAREALVRQERGFAWQVGTRWRISTHPRPEVSGHVFGPTQTILRFLQERGPCSTWEARVKSRLKPSDPLPLGELRTLGVHDTPFGKERILSIGPLPQGYVNKRRETARARKQKREAVRWQRRKLGLTADEYSAVQEAHVAVGNLFYEHYRFDFPQALEGWVQECGRRFQEWLTFEKCVDSFKALDRSTYPNAVAQRILQDYVPQWNRDGKMLPKPNFKLEPSSMSGRRGDEWGRERVQGP